MNLPDAVPQINMTNLPTVGGGRVVLNRHDLFMSIFRVKLFICGRIIPFQP